MGFSRQQSIGHRACARTALAQNTQRGTHPGEELVNVHKLVYRVYLAAHRAVLQTEATTTLLEASVLSARLGLVGGLRDAFQ